jgi:hypothetical protein
MEENYGGQGGRGECVQPRIETKEELETCEVLYARLCISDLTKIFLIPHIFLFFQIL